MTLNIETKSLERMIRTLINNISGVHIVKQSEKNISKDTTEEFINKFYGAWKGDESADEIIANIKQGGSSRPPVTFD